MNVKFSYLYRDYANYKNFGEVVFLNPNGLPIDEIESAIRKHLMDDDLFQADKWKLPDLHFANWDSDDDHFYHEFESVEETGDDVNSEMSIDDFLNHIINERKRFGLEPLDVDLYVVNRPLAKEDQELISQHIREYKTKTAKMKSYRANDKKKSSG